MFLYSSLYILSTDLITKYPYKKLINLHLINELKTNRPKIQLYKKKNENYFNILLLFFLKLIINNKIKIKNNFKDKNKIKIIHSNNYNYDSIYQSFLLPFSLKVDYYLDKDNANKDLLDNVTKINDVIFFFPLILNYYK
jgi:hypothetical protein